MTPSQRLAGLLTRPVNDAGQVGWRGLTAVSWPEFSARARGWQAAFKQTVGSRFVLFFADGLEFAAALFGLWQAGKQAWLPGDLTAGTQAALRQHVDGWAGDGSGLADLPRVQPTTDMASVAKTPLDAEAEALVVFTSGSTGAPEPFPKRLRQLFDEINGLEHAFGTASPACTVVASVSAQHVYGLLFRVLWPLGTGRPMQARSLVYLEDLADLVPGGHRAALIASPTHLGRLPLAVPDAARRVDQVFSSGAPLPDTAVPDMLRVFGQAPIEVYGSTETGGVAWRQRNPGASRVWQALPGVHWRLDDGQLVIRSQHLPTDDWTPCADRATAMDGGFELVGRADRVIKIAEKRVSMRAIEDRLLQGGLLSAVRLIALDEPRTQLGVVAVPTPQGWALHDGQGRRALAEALREQLLGVIDRVALPRRWRFVPELPCNAQGKSTHARLLAEFDSRRPAVREVVRDGSKVALTLLVDAALPQFDGHFTGHPVLPGVAQLDWALLLGQELFDIPGDFMGMEALKFQRVVVPGTRVMLHLDWQGPGRLSFRYESAVGPHASGRLLFSDPARP
jgi:acyl-CoA synthetase (AMP-forming)/AMP-acid ligase II